MIRFAAFIVPQCRYAGIENILSLLVGSVLANAGLDVKTKYLVNFLSLHNKI